MLAYSLLSYRYGSIDVKVKYRNNNSRPLRVHIPKLSDCGSERDWSEIDEEIQGVDSRREVEMKHIERNDQLLSS